MNGVLIQITFHNGEEEFFDLTTDTDRWEWKWRVDSEKGVLVVRPEPGRLRYEYPLVGIRRYTVHTYSVRSDTTSPNPGGGAAENIPVDREQEFPERSGQLRRHHHDCPSRYGGDCWCTPGPNGQAIFTPPASGGFPRTTFFG